MTTKSWTSRNISDSTCISAEDNEGITYACQRCTQCCQWPGFVKLTDEEILRISRFLEISEYEFIQKYTRLRPQRSGLSLIDKPNGHCVFLEGRDCMIQPVKPDQCRGFPNRWRFPGWRDMCEAIPVRNGKPVKETE